MLLRIDFQAKLVRLAGKALSLNVNFQTQSLLTVQPGAHNVNFSKQAMELVIIAAFSRTIL